jgi:glycine dehydrogenase
VYLYRSHNGVELTEKFKAREQHIRREKATSNICTSQALLANMAALYAVYHGPVGLRHIAHKVHGLTQALKYSVERLGFKVVNNDFFDTLTIDVSGVVQNSDIVHRASAAAGINLRRVDGKHVGVSLDESVGPVDWTTLVNVFASAVSADPISVSDVSPAETHSIPSALWRTSEYLPQPVFNKHHSETEMLRYIFHLASKDLGLVHAMIPLGSCTMKLNSTSSMIPLTWSEFSGVHPFAPIDQVKGYLHIIKVQEVRNVASFANVLV